MIGIRTLGGRLSAFDLMLVRACVGPPDVDESWAGILLELERDAGMSSMSGERQELLGRLWARTKGLEIDRDISDRLKGLYRRAWYRNRLLLARFSAALILLRGAGIECLVVDDAALLFGFYRSVGERPLERTAILVASESIMQAVRVLEAGGWNVRSRSAGMLPDTDDTWQLEDHDGLQLELQTAPRDRSFGETEEPPVRTDTIWDRAHDLDFDGTPVRCPGPEHTLLRLLADSRGWGRRPRLVRITDAALVMQGWTGEPEFLVLEARHHHVVPQVLERVTWLRDELHVEVPHQLTVLLDRERVDLLDSATYRVERFSPATARHLRTTRPAGPVRATLGLPAALRDSWGLERTRSVPLAAARKLMTYLRARDPDGTLAAGVHHHRPDARSTMPRRDEAGRTGQNRSSEPKESGP